MKNLFSFIVLLLASVSISSAQDHYLPVSSKSTSALTSYNRALSLVENAKISEYVQAMNSAVVADPNLFAGYAHLALAMVSFKEYDQAKVMVTKALAIAPDNFTNAEKILRKLMVQWGKDIASDPMPILDELIAAFPKNWQAYDMAASAATWIKQDDQSATPYLQNMVRLRPDNGSAYNSLGYLYIKSGELDKAKKAFENYIRVAPTEANAYDSMGEYYMTVKDYPKSAELYDKAASLGMTDSAERAAKARSMIK
jgi:tetratricopeptide (TPR) repeat protein